MAEIGMSVTLERLFDGAIEDVIAALAEEGFGVISRIDLDKAFAEQLVTAIPSLGHATQNWLSGQCTPGPMWVCSCPAMLRLRKARPGQSSESWIVRN